MFRKYILAIMIFICTFLLTLVPLSAQEEEGKIIISDQVGKEIQAEKHQYQNLSKPQTVDSDSGEIQGHQNVVYKEPGTAFYLELGGKFFGSVNVDFPIKKSNRLSFGLVVLVLPNVMYFYLPGEKNSRFELGCGFTYNYLEDDIPVWIHGVLGYRYQKKKGFLFRAGFTPILYLGKDSGFFPLIGISFGYSL